MGEGGGFHNWFTKSDLCSTVDRLQPIVDDPDPDRIELLVSLIGIPGDAAASAQGGWNIGATLCFTVGFMLTNLDEFG